MDSPQITIRQLTKLLGLLSCTIQAVFPAPLHFRHLQEVKNAAFALDRSYDSLISLPPLALEELTWWRDNLEAWNGKGLVSGTPDRVIKTDASRNGWGAYCMGVSTGGQWTEGETQLHINCLELLAGAFAIQTFVGGKVRMKVCLLMDNMTAAHYINKMGGDKIPHSRTFGCRSVELVSRTPDSHRDSVHSRSSECTSRQGIQSHVRSSRLETRPQSLCRVKSAVGSFGSRPICFAPHRSTTSLLQLATRPSRRSPGCVFTELDLSIQGFAFPPFALIGRCLRKLLDQGVSRLVLVAPVWKFQPWYPLLPELCIASPVLLPQYSGLLTRQGEMHPLAQLQLAGWQLSADSTQRLAFLKGRKNYSLPPGEKVPPLHIPQLGENGIADAVNGKLIQFSHQLSAY